MAVYGCDKFSPPPAPIKNFLRPDTFLLVRMRIHYCPRTVNQLTSKHANKSTFSLGKLEPRSSTISCMLSHSGYLVFYLLTFKSLGTFSRPDFRLAIQKYINTWSVCSEGVLGSVL